MPSQAKKVRKAPQLLTINGSSHLSQSQKNVQSMTPSSSARARITDVRFVLCQSQTPQERNILQDAFQFCRSRNLTEAKLVEGRELQTLTQESEGSARIIYILHPFTGPAFSLLKERSSRIYGPACIVTCVRKNQPIPSYNGYPIANMAMMSVEVCCSNMEGPPRDALYEKVGSMAGRVTKGLSTTATHLVTPQVGSPKYYAAAKAGKKIVLPSWVDEIYKAASTGEDFSRNDQLVERHKVPVFRGCSISISQIPCIEVRKAFQDRIRSHGGDYQKDMCKEKTTHLVCDEPTGHKFVAAKKWNIPVVTTNWITDCINKGYNIQVDQYLLAEARPNTPDHVKQGPNGVRATSTPNKGARKLDHTLDISAIQRAPVIHAIEHHQENGAGLSVVQEEPVVWLPDHGKIAEKEQKQLMFSTKEQQDLPGTLETLTKKVKDATLGDSEKAPSVGLSTLNEIVKVPLVGITNMVTDPVVPVNGTVVDALKDDASVGVRSSASASPNSETIRGKSVSAPSLAERILAGMQAKNTVAVSAASDEASSLSSNHQQMLDVLKLERRVKPAATRIRKNTRISPVQQRALLCWSQAPRNPFKENGQLGEGLEADEGHVNEEDEESPPVDVVPPIKNGPVVSTAMTTGKLKEQQTESAPKKSLVGSSSAVTVPVEAAKNGRSKDSLPLVEKLSAKRNVELVELSDDESNLAADTADTAAQKVVKKTEEPKRAYLFMVSGVTIESEKKRLFSCIRQLGATYADSVQYTPEATHLIVKFPVRNEKYLACCAAGKWVLHAKYLEDSVAAGHFLPETMYEWGNYEHAATLMGVMSECDTKLAKSVHRWRQKVQTTGKLAFEGWKVVLAADPTRSEGYVRLLEAGGAKVLTARSPFLPYKDEATHLLHELTKVAVSPTDLAAFVTAGVVCQKADYLSHFLTDENYSSPTPSQSAEPSHSRRPAKKSRR